MMEKRLSRRLDKIEKKLSLGKEPRVVPQVIVARSNTKGKGVEIVYVDTEKKENNGQETFDTA